MKDENKYDRQIRLFGKDVQLKLSNLTVSVLSETDDNFISGEILKNLVLLGVNKIYADENTLKSYNKLLPNKITEINPKVTLLDKIEGFLFVVGNDKMVEYHKPLNNDDTIFYISCTTLSYNINKKIIENSTTSYTPDKVKECLLGAIVVQEFIKLIQNQKYQTSFSLHKLL